MKSLSYIPRNYLDKFWDQIKDLLASGLQLCEGELDINQLRLLITQGHATVIVATSIETDEIVGALAFEVVNYPNYRCANVISIGGHNLFSDEHDMEQFKSILKKAGISKIQGWCSPAIARMWKSKFNFTTPYTMVRSDVE
jgi:hypothetical protein